MSAPVDGGLATLWPDPERPRAWTLSLDGAPQSHVDLDDPGYLDFSYQRRLGHVIDLAAPAGAPLTVLHLGGGALTLARYVAATRPRSVQQVLERDVALTERVRQWLPPRPEWRIRVRGVDAREGLARYPDGWADLVIADVFRGARTPAHLTSVEFLGAVRRVLKPEGWYAANLTDGPPLDFLRGQLATATEWFGSLCATADPEVWRRRRFGNVVLLAGQGELPVAALRRRASADPASGRVLAGRELDELAAGARTVTDTSAVPSPAPPPGTFD
ncbi:fused MFS/spermidine synthase [Streptomyces sp. NPDC005438]|uniref:spermidine synthase n=1 Tax=Streptomyces sp. NPDC005438 TaxID=3156880 RepID=UPI0033BF6A81